MQIDYDLVRDIMLKVEELDDGKSEILLGYFREDYFPDFELDFLRYHMAYLMDKEYLRSGMNKGQPWRENHIKGLTPQGHDFLESVRSDTVWSKTKEKMAPLGSVAISVVSELATAVTKGMLGINS